MAVSDKDIKLLWGRAAGMCSKPDCRRKLSDLGERDESYLVGEMAHVIAKNVGGPRTDGKGGADTYDNLILLCPTDHRDIDKSPEGTYPEALLHAWKREHETWIDEVTTSNVVQSREELIINIFDLLGQNKLIYEEFGPNSINAINNPSSSAAFYWNLRKLDTIIPNNKRIISAIVINRKLIGKDLMEPFGKFQLHAQAFESNQYNRVDHYPLFPKEFAEAVEREVIELG